jgi:hypothetical protein
LYYNIVQQFNSIVSVTHVGITNEEMACGYLLL